MCEEQPNSDGSERERAGTSDDRPVGRSLRTDGGRDLDEYFGALAHRRRRTVLYSLRDREYTTFDDLVEQVVRRERDAVGETNEEVRRAVRIELHHAHLPKLEDAGIISYDRRNDSLRYHSPKLVEQLLDFCRSMETAEAEE